MKANLSIRGSTFVIRVAFILIDKFETGINLNLEMDLQDIKKSLSQVQLNEKMIRYKIV